MMLRRSLMIVILLFGFALSVDAKPSHPSIQYTIRLAAADTTAFDVTMRIRNAPDTFLLAMAAHPEYDDKYWRYVERPTVTGGKLGATIIRVDSALWRVVSYGESIVRYRIRLPPRDAGQRGAWRPFFTSTGALIGDLHSFMYIVGAERAPALVKVDVPPGWKVATALEATSDPTVFLARDAEDLAESPILVGNLRTWRFVTAGVPHRIVYWPRPDAAKFDTVAFVDGIRRLTEQATALFRGAPYREYVFLFQDDSNGALEHPNSVTLGAPSTELADDPNDLLGETAHEYFHLWNLMRIRPVERTGLDYRPARETRGLWFSEGLSLYYSDLLIRRAGIAGRQATRVKHLENLIARYLGNSAYVHFSPEESSLGANRSTRGTFGDYSPSVHLQGEIVGTLLDLIIRDATNGSRSIDDVMRLMLKRYSGNRGFDGKDIERTVEDVCTCDVTYFFDSHVRGSKPIDFNRYLRLAGMESRVTWVPATTDSGTQQADVRMYGWMPPGESRPRLLVTDPNSIWAKSGLHTGDQVVSVNGAAMNSWPDLRNVLRSLTIGDTLRFEVARGGRPLTATVVVSGYQRPSVTITPITAATVTQRRLGEAWLAGKP